VISSENLRIDTPEQIALELPIAGVGSRFLALAVDTLLQALLFILATIGVAVILPLLIARVPGLTASRALLPAILVIFMFSLYWGYFTIFEILWKGQTPGKRIADIRVIRDDGRPIDATAAVLRNLLRVVDLLPGMYAVGVIVMLLNRNSRRLGDFAAGTVVVHERQAQTLDPGWTPTPVRARAAPEAARITDAELVLIETYLDRRFGFTPTVRQNAARHIADRIIERTGLQPEPGQDVDDFLQAVAGQARDMGRLRQPSS
jgi:uncharacterized RDD family membrane protein YckC